MRTWIFQLLQGSVCLNAFCHMSYIPRCVFYETSQRCLSPRLKVPWVPEMRGFRSPSSLYFRGASARGRHRSFPPQANDNRTFDTQTRFNQYQSINNYLPTLTSKSTSARSKYERALRMIRSIALYIQLYRNVRLC